MAPLVIINFALSQMSLVDCLAKIALSSSRKHCSNLFSLRELYGIVIGKCKVEQFCTSDSVLL